MKELILIKSGEIALKGLNKSTFEDILSKNIRRRIKKYGDFQIKRAQSTFYLTPKSDDIDLDAVCDTVGRIFGISAFSRALITEKDLDVIKRDAVSYLQEVLGNAKTFKVISKRSDKQFPYRSPEIQEELGATLLDAFPHLKVDVHNPEVAVTVEIRDYAAYIHAKVYHGAGGLPVGSSGKALLLISGGIDSPVAGYMMAKRGIQISAIHFVSPPYTSDRALQKVQDLCQLVCEYSGSIQFYCVPFTNLQLAIRDHCPEELFTIIMRRLMMQISLRIAEQNNLLALITGESVGQVASQTLGAIAATDAVCTIPVLRPLIGMDKNEIIDIARKINTFDTSILPYDDCCTVFTPKHPRTHPKLSAVEEAQAAFDFEPLIEEAIQNISVTLFSLEREPKEQSAEEAGKGF